MKEIFVKGARTHNLKNIDVRIPRDQLVVLTGLSGSGKSSLAFDTIYAEGQRRYVESLSSYARQFIGQMDKPDVDMIEGLSPAVSVEQKAVSHNPRSTVGTVTEIYDYLRVLFARIGKPFCYQCGKIITKQTVSQITNRLLSESNNEIIFVLAPVVRGRKGEYAAEFKKMQALGFTRARVDGELKDLDDCSGLDKKKKHHIDILIDRLRIVGENRSRLFESIENAFKIAQDLVVVEFLDANRNVKHRELFSGNEACIDCGINYPKIEPQMFSFNSPQGACAECAGLGELMHVDEDLVVPDEKISINKGAIIPWFGKKTNYYQALLEGLAKKFRFDLDVPFCELPEKIRKILFDGTSDFIRVDMGRNSYDGFFEGIKNNLMRRYKETDSDWMRAEIAKFMSYQTCPVCKGTRLKKESLFVRIGEKSIFDICTLSLRELADFFDGIKLSATEKEISKLVIKEIRERVGFLCNVGLDYLNLSRQSHTLSGGEAQRIRLATQIGSALVGVLYVLDEPSIGLHQRDNDRLIQTLKILRDLGNTVLVVEHDEDTIRASDFVIDMGPGAGIHGGEIVYAGTPQEMMKAQTQTAQYLSGTKKIEVPQKRRKGGATLELQNVSHHNLKNVSAEIPLGCFVCVTGVSGSGKSSLINDTLIPLLEKNVLGLKTHPPKGSVLKGFSSIDKVINIDQSPIGRTPRSNPATYTGLFTAIRELFAELPESKARGYSPGRYSFNVKGGRCESCAGDGVLRIEMHFLADVYVKCENCDGKRFNAETLAVQYKGKSIADVLRLSVEEASVFFKNIPQIVKKLETLLRVGLGYIELGQAATTLSGGEAQRIKLSRELSKRSTGRTFYVLDEPTTGLHFEDIRLLLEVLHELTDQGNTVLVIEHNLHVIKTADWIIDLGPEGGNFGGKIIARGTPENLIKENSSVTGQYLKSYII